MGECSVVHIFLTLVLSGRERPFLRFYRLMPMDIFSLSIKQKAERVPGHLWMRWWEEELYCCWVSNFASDLSVISNYCTCCAQDDDCYYFSGGGSSSSSSSSSINSSIIELIKLKECRIAD